MCNLKVTNGVVWVGVCGVDVVLVKLLFTSFLKTGSRISTLLTEGKAEVRE